MANMAKLSTAPNENDGQGDHAAAQFINRLRDDSVT